MKRAISFFTALALIASGAHMLPAEELTSRESIPEQSYVYQTPVHEEELTGEALNEYAGEESQETEPVILESTAEDIEENTEDEWITGDELSPEETGASDSDHESLIYSFIEEADPYRQPSGEGLENVSVSATVTAAHTKLKDYLISNGTYHYSTGSKGSYYSTGVIDYNSSGDTKFFLSAA